METSSNYKNFTLLTLLIALSIFSSFIHAAINKKELKENNRQVITWNKFADDLLTVSDYLLARNETRISEISDNYGGEVWRGDGFIETSYFNKKTGKLLSRIRRQNKKPNHVHTVEVYIYDKSGKLVRDYIAAYIPGFRNAPIQTLINFHKNDGDLRSFRQFDASGRRIYEQCQGKFFNKTVDISLEDYEIPNHAGEIKEFMARENYRACFEGLPVTAGNYLTPLHEITSVKNNALKDENKDFVDVEKSISKLTKALYKNPRNPDLYYKRGNGYFLIHEFDKAIEDYTDAIRFKLKTYDAYFGRGMAYGRAGETEKSITDLSVFIKHNPRSSLAYTKRGVRKIWAGKLTEAEKDLKIAVKLDPSNSEAHDDLGVLLAQKKDFNSAIKHFQTSIKHDPSYQKAYHNLAMVYFITENNKSSLKAVNNALKLSANNKNSLLLKSEILKSMGQIAEAQKIQEIAEFLPKGNWSEQFEIQ